MLDAKFIRQNIEAIQLKVEQRRTEVRLDEFIQLDAERLRLIRETEELQRRRNEATKEIKRKRSAGEDAQELIDSSRGLSADIKTREEELRVAERGLEEIALTLPNIPHESVPVGEGEEDNVEIRRWGEVPEFGFEPQPHWELGEQLGIIDFECAARLSGARFAVLRGQGCRLERALIQFMMDVQTQQHGYLEIWPPFLANRESMLATGQIPKLEADMFRCEDPGYYLVPTAEVPLVNLHRGEILAAEDLPLNYCAYTPCFRREAGSYGKDTRGLIRQHQFNKVELVKLCTPESSYDEHEALVRDASRILELLGLPYRIVELCTADLGFAAAKCYDLEVWIPTQQRYREISSCSNCEDFQARRGNIRFRPEPRRKPELVHTLNGSGLAIGRTFVAILENFQLEDGTVEIPEVLRPYLGGQEKIVKQ